MTDDSPIGHRAGFQPDVRIENSDGALPNEIARRRFESLEIRGIRKQFGGVEALRDVSLVFKAGTVHAVVGENGAGKSTLMKIMAGAEFADRGEIAIDGKRCRIRSTSDALKIGIALIHQELNLADNLSVGANIYLGREPTRWGLIDDAKINRDSQRFLAMVGLAIDPKTPVDRLSIGAKQLVEIAKALSVGASVLIMDEPTSSLTLGETQNLLRVIASLKSTGVAVIYISHRLREIESIADHVSVLRDGQNAGDLTKDEITHQAMIRLMVGREMGEIFPPRRRRLGEVRLRVNEIQTQAYRDQRVSVVVRGGQCVGVAGLIGAGRTELLRAIFGIDRAVAGRVVIDGRAIRRGDVIEAIKNGLALVPEDRKQQGVILSMSIEENVSLASLRRHSDRFGFLKSNHARKESARLLDQFGIKASSTDSMVNHLSGGNQQKVVLAKWLATKPSVLLLDEPTRGVDVGAKQEIYHLIEELLSLGVAVLLVSSDMEEVRGLSDRIIVMHQGRVSAEFDNTGSSGGSGGESSEMASGLASEEAIMRAAVGQTKDGENES